MRRPRKPSGVSTERIDPEYWRQTKYSGAGPLGPSEAYVQKLEADAERMREALEVIANYGPSASDRATARAALNPEDK